MKLAIFASGNGSNFQALVTTLREKKVAVTVDWLFCDQPEAHVLQRAEKLGVPVSQFSPKDFANKVAYEQEILRQLRERKIDLVILAGYMRIVGPTLLTAFENKIVNIHPSLLPNFPGLHGIRDAYEAGVATTGVTVHLIDAGVDTGPIIRQEKVEIEPTDTLEILEQKIHAVEHRIYPEIVEEMIKNGGYLK